MPADAVVESRQGPIDAGVTLGQVLGLGRGRQHGEALHRQPLVVRPEGGQHLAGRVVVDGEPAPFQVGTCAAPREAPHRQAELAREHKRQLPEAHGRHDDGDDGPAGNEDTIDAAGDAAEIGGAVQAAEVGDDGVEGSALDTVELQIRTLLHRDPTVESVPSDLVPDAGEHPGRDVGGVHPKAALGQLDGVGTRAGVQLEDPGPGRHESFDGGVHLLPHAAEVRMILGEGVVLRRCPREGIGDGG